MRLVKLTALALVLLWSAGFQAFAAGLDAPAPPEFSGSAMFTLEDVYNRLAHGTVGAPRVGPFREPAKSPSASGRTIDEIMAVAPAVQPSPARDWDVVAGKTFWGLDAGQWGPRVGRMAIMELNPTSFKMDAGYYAATNLSRVATNLNSGNIKADAKIFGITGSPMVVDTSPGNAGPTDIRSGRLGWVNGELVTGTAPAGKNFTATSGALSALIPEGLYNGSQKATFSDANLLAKYILEGVSIFGVAGSLPPPHFYLQRTGQTTKYKERDDGHLKKGLAPPNPRFVVQGDINAENDPLTNCVLDRLTGLMWARSVTNAPGVAGKSTWATALTKCNNLELGGYDDWRLPNINELMTLTDYSQCQPALPSGHPFLDINDLEGTHVAFWSSTRAPIAILPPKERAYLVYFNPNGKAEKNTIDTAIYVLPVCWFSVNWTNCSFELVEYFN